jgi:hypothetical protein
VCCLTNGGVRPGAGAASRRERPRSGGPRQGRRRPATAQPPPGRRWAGLPARSRRVPLRRATRRG